MSDPAPTGRPEHRWPVVAFVTVIIVLWAVLPDDVQFIPRWIIPTIVIAMAVVLIIVNPLRFSRETTWSRPLSIVLAFGLALINQVYVVLLVSSWSPIVRTARMCCSSPSRSGSRMSSRSPSCTGSSTTAARTSAGWRSDTQRQEDFLFPQETVERLQPWQPNFFDYVYFSLSNMTAFSPDRRHAA